MTLVKKIIEHARFRQLQFTLKKNWYWPNLAALRQERIILTGGVPLCNQYTMVTGEGKITIGKDCVFGFKLGGRHRNGAIELQARYKDARIFIGDNVATNNNIFICAAAYIEIGSDSLIGEGVTIIDHEAHGLAPNLRRQLGETGQVKIGRNVWIGNGVTILKNSVIGDNTIIAAGAVVAGRFAADVIIGGVPAKVIRQL